MTVLTMTSKNLPGQSHDTEKFGHFSRGARTKNDCAGEGQKQITRNPKIFGHL
jgi:hypothetical protein